MQESKVQKRIAKTVHNFLADVFIKELQPHIPNTILSISYVKITKDLNIAKVFISTFPEDKLKEVLQFLNSPEGNKIVRRMLAQRIRNKVKRIPELHFFEDEISKEAEKIEDLLEDIKKGKKPDIPDDI